MLLPCCQKVRVKSRQFCTSRCVENPNNGLLIYVYYYVPTPNITSELHIESNCIKGYNHGLSFIYLNKNAKVFALIRVGSILTNNIYFNIYNSLHSLYEFHRGHISEVPTYINQQDLLIFFVQFHLICIQYYLNHINKKNVI